MLASRPLVIILWSASACAPEPAKESLPCDVAQALARRCQICHSNPPAAGAPFSLVTFEDTRRANRLNHDAPVWQSIGEALSAGRMPLDPRTGNPAPMPEDDPDRVTLTAWAARGAPSGESCGY
jgi:hypothetical protein